MRDKAASSKGRLPVYRPIEPHAKEIPLHVDHRKGEAAAHDAGQQAAMTDQLAHQLDGRIGPHDRLVGAMTRT